jgi:hypothetical protein
MESVRMPAHPALAAVPYAEPDLRTANRNGTIWIMNSCAFKKMLPPSAVQLFSYHGMMLSFHDCLEKREKTMYIEAWIAWSLGILFTLLVAKLSKRIYTLNRQVLCLRYCYRDIKEAGERFFSEGPELAKDDAVDWTFDYFNEEWKWRLDGHQKLMRKERIAPDPDPGTYFTGT